MILPASNKWWKHPDKNSFEFENKSFHEILCCRRNGTFCHFQRFHRVSIDVQPWRNVWTLVRVAHENFEKRTSHITHEKLYSLPHLQSWKKRRPVFSKSVQCTSVPTTNWEGRKRLFDWRWPHFWGRRHIFRRNENMTFPGAILKTFFYIYMCFQNRRSWRHNNSESNPYIIWLNEQYKFI